MKFIHALSLSLSLAGAFASGAFAKSDSTLVYCVEGSPSTFNPASTFDGPSDISNKQIFNQLVEFKPGTQTIEPSLAESWTVSKDKKAYTFRLRKGVKFHSNADFTPTRELNADDVVFSFDRIVNPAHPFHKVNGGIYPQTEGFGWRARVLEVKALDPHTVRFTLAEPDAIFLAALTGVFSSVISAEYGAALLAKGTPEKIDHAPIGTGPFVFKEYLKDNYIRYAAHEGYFRGRPKSEKLVISIVSDPMVRLQKLRTKECHIVFDLGPWDDVDQKTTTVEKVPGVNVAYVAFNTSHPPFDNKKVREAINLAIDRKQLLAAVFNERAKLGMNPFPPSLLGFHKGVAAPPTDIAKAKQLLKEAGYANGFATKMLYLPISRPYNPMGKKAGELIKASLAKVGIEVALETYDWPTYIKMARSGYEGMVMLGNIVNIGEPEGHLSLALGCPETPKGLSSNISRWCNDRFVKLVNEARASLSRESRVAALAKAQTVFAEDMPWATLGYSDVVKAYRKEVRGYKPGPTTSDSFYGVSVE